MKIILVATDARGKSLVFVTDTLQIYSLQEATQLAREKKLENVYPVQSHAGAYLRTKPRIAKKEQLDQLSISSYQLFSALDNINYALTTPAFANYWRLYQGSFIQGQPLITIEGKSRITKDAVRSKLQPYRDLVFDAAQRFNVDPYLLGAVIIDEIARFGVIEPITDPLAGYFIGVNTSAGIAQVGTDTARGLIQNDYYNPNPSDIKLSPANIQKVSRSHLYQYVKKPEHSISFAAARMRALTDEWKKFVDLNKMPEIIATLYSLEHRNPHSNPQPNDRGLQIANEFYKLAKEYLGLP